MGTVHTSSKGCHFVALKELWSRSQFKSARKRRFGSYACSKKPKPPYIHARTHCHCLKSVYHEHKTSTTLLPPHHQIPPFVYARVCVYVCVCVCVCVNMNVRACMSVHVHVCMRVHVQLLCVLACASVHVSMRTCMCAYACARARGCVHARVRECACCFCSCIISRNSGFRPYKYGIPCTYIHTYIIYVRVYMSG